MPRTLIALNVVTLLALWISSARSLTQVDPSSPLHVGELVLVDDQGRARARLGFDDKGQPELGFLAESGEKRFRVGFVRSTDTGFEAYVPGGRKSVELRCRAEGTNSLMFKNAAGGNAFRLAALASGASLLDLSHADGGAAELRVMSSGQPDLVMNDADGRLRASLGVIRNGLSSLALFDHHTKSEVAVYAAKADKAGITLFDAGRRPRVVLGAPLDAKTRDVGEGLTSRAQILDGQGNTLWAMPE